MSHEIHGNGKCQSLEWMFSSWEDMRWAGCSELFRRTTLGSPSVVLFSNASCWRANPRNSTLMRSVLCMDNFLISRTTNKASQDSDQWGSHSIWGHLALITLAIMDSISPVTYLQERGILFSPYIFIVASLSILCHHWLPGLWLLCSEFCHKPLMCLNIYC